jgi:membrane-bound lytic murein transglycosylase F
MPKTAAAFGLPADSLTHPESNVRAAAELIRRLNRSFASIEDETERLKFILAAYNAGASRIYDAQVLAEEYGKNPSQWENNVEECLREKGLPETTNYVQAILNRWRYYQTKISNP